MHSTSCHAWSLKYIFIWSLKYKYAILLYHMYVFGFNRNVGLVALRGGSCSHVYEAAHGFVNAHFMFIV